MTVEVKSTLTDYQRQATTRQPTAYAQRYLSVKSDDTDFEATDVQAEHGGNVYLQSDAASPVHGEESWRETDLGGQRIRQYSRRAEDFTHPTGGQSRITVGGKEVKPGSKQYKEALAALNRGDTIGVEAEAEYKRDAAEELKQMKQDAGYNSLTSEMINKANSGDK